MVEYFKGPPCGQENCREKRFYIADDGYTYCRRGHRTEAKVITAQEDPTEYGRFSKKTRKVMEDTEEIPKDEPHQSIALYLQCYQMVLRKQVHWLIHQGGYPPQLEQTLKDIWVLRVQIIQDMLKDPKEESEQKLFSSQNIPDYESRTRRERYTRYRRFFDVPQIYESLALCYLALVVLKVPVSLSDVRNWCLSDDFVYVQAGSGKVIPLSLFRRVPANLRQRLLVQKGLPESGELADLTMSYADFFNHTFGIQFPSLRETPILYRALSEFAMPIEVYQGLRALSYILSWDFAFPRSKPEHRYTADHPEIRLMSLFVVIVKLYYPFDDVLRTPRRPTEPTSFTIDWEVWNRELQDQSQDQNVPEDNKRINERALNRTAQDVFSMDGPEIDEYLDWFQRQFITDEIDERGTTAEFSRALYGMFPLDEPPRDPVDPGMLHDFKRTAMIQRMRRVQQSSIQQPSVVSDKGDSDGMPPLRPGARYRIYRQVSDIPQDSNLFFEMCSKTVGLSLKQMVHAVYRTEMKIQRKLASMRSARKERSEEDLLMQEPDKDVDGLPNSMKVASDSDDDMS